MLTKPQSTTAICIELWDDFFHGNASVSKPEQRKLRLIAIKKYVYDKLGLNYTLQ